MVEGEEFEMVPKWASEEPECEGSDEMPEVAQDGWSTRGDNVSMNHPRGSKETQ